MGQYWTLINLDKKEQTSAFALNSGTKLMEMAWSEGPAAALVVLLAVRGGDHVAIGRWAGDRIVLIGDYAEEDDTERSVWGEDEPNNLEAYVDISDLVSDVLRRRMRTILEECQEHWMVYNLSKKEFFSPAAVGCPPFLDDLACNIPRGAGFCLHLLAASFPEARGGGDPQSGHPAIGKWAASRLAVISDEANEHDMWPGVWGGDIPLDFSQYENISSEVRAMVVAETEEEDEGMSILRREQYQDPYYPKRALPSGPFPSVNDTAQSLWRSLPTEIIAIVIRFAPSPRDAASLRLASRQWRRAASDSVTHLRPTRQLWDAALAQLVGAFPNLTSLDLSGCARITDQGLLPLFACSALRTLDLSATSQLDGSGLVATKNLTCLRVNQAPNFLCLKVLERLPGLRRLEMRRVGWTDYAMENLTAAPFAGALTSLLFARPSFEEQGKDLLCSAFTNLVELEMSDCKNLTDDWVLDFGKAFAGLESLNIRKTQVTDTGLQAMAACLPTLTSLDIARCPRISAWGLEYLEGLPRLASLSLRDCCQLKSSDEIVQRLKRMPSLTFVDLNGINCVSSGTVAALKDALPRLTKVDYGAPREYDPLDRFAFLGL